MTDQEEFTFNGRKGDKPGDGNGAAPVRSVGTDAETKVLAAEGEEGHPATLDLGNGPFKQLMDSNFLLYASYVICERALPTLEDGLKPVQRRILHSLHEKDDGRFIKVANIVGHTMQYHPHGDASIGDALVNLTNRLFLIEGQGNFGNIITGDRAAAARYIECRLTELARHEVLNKDLTEYVLSYDGRNKEPVMLPSKLPLLLMLGAEGIAVGLSTRILPHNFRELLEAQIAILRKDPFVILPDFQQGGLMDVTEYNGGLGSVRVRAVIKTEDERTLVITEMPFGVTSDTLIPSIEEAARRKKIPVSKITDYTAEKAEVELALTSGADVEKAKQALYAFTLCENKLSCRPILLASRRPVEMSVDQILRENTKNLVRLLERELKLRRHNLLEDLHEKSLVQLFVEHRIYKRIEECKTAPDVVEAVLTGLEPFKSKLRREVTKADVDMLLSIKIRRISLFDMNKNRKDMEAILAELTQVEKDLHGLNAYAVRYLRALLKKHGDLYPRRTRISKFDEIEIKELTAKELEIFYDKEGGYLGYGVKDGQSMMHCSSYDKLIAIYEGGKYKMMPPPEKLYVGKLHYVGKYDRDRVMTLLYKDDFTYIKRFTFGGAITHKEYSCVPDGASVVYVTDVNAEHIHVRYAPAERQRIKQQMFKLQPMPIRQPKNLGLQMTSKKINAISVTKPSWWDDSEASPRGILMK